MLFKKSTILLTSAMFAGTALASVEAATKLDQVVVTATKTEQSIDRVTASVQVISEDDIAKMGAVSLKDIFNNTPGLVLQYGTFPSGSSASKSSVNIRGLGATGSLWLIDGRRLAGEVKNPYDMDRIPASMIERIEIVKGPMSALYGADAVGGVINIITKQGKDGFMGQVSLTSGANGDGDGSNTELSASVRGGTENFRGSFYASTTDAQPYSETEKATTKIGSGKHLINTGANGIPTTPGYLKPAHPQTKGNPFYVQADGSVKPKPLDGTKLASDQAFAQQSFTDFRNQALNKIQPTYDVDVTYREEAKVNTVGGRGEFDATKKLTLGAEFNWFEEERNGVYRAVFHPMGFKPPVGMKANPITGHDSSGNPTSKQMGKVPSWDVPVNSKDENSRLDVAVDGTYDVSDDLDVNFRVYNSYYEKRNTTTMKEFADFGYPSEEKSAASGMSADVDIWSYELGSNWQVTDNHLLTAGAEYREEKRDATVFDSTPNMATREVAYTAFYLQDDFSVSDSLAFTVGGRFDQHEQKAYTDANGVARDSKTDSETTFRAGMVKNFSPMANLRVSIAQGYRVPDIRELFIHKQTPAGMQLGAQAIETSVGKTTAYDLKPEKTMSYEIGFAGANQKLNYAISVFQNDIEDKIDTDPNITSYTTFINVDNAMTQGAELTVGYQLSKNLSTNLFWTELSTEDKKTGKDLPFNPDRVVSLGLDWAATSRINLGLNATHTGEQYYQLNKQDMKTDAYTLTNLTANWALGTNKNVSLFGGINNIADEKVDKRLGSSVGPYYYAGVKANF